MNAITANTVLLGNGTGAISTTSAGTNGQVLALVSGVPTWVATSSINNGVSSLAQTFGTAQTGAVTFATSSQTTNGQTTGLTITNTAGAFTFAPTLSGTLTVGGGGTGQTTFASGQLLYGNGTNALSSVATGTVASGAGISVTGGQSIIGSGLTITNTGVTSLTGTANQITASAGTGAVTLSIPTQFNISNASTTNLSANTLAVGGTGTTSISSTGSLSTPSLSIGSLAGVLYGNSGAVNAIATSSFTPNAEFTTTGTIGAFVGGTNSTLALATNGVALTKLAQIAANTILGNPTGATGNVTALSTSTLSIGGTAGNVTGIVAVSNGGTGWNAITANTVLLGNGTGAISTTSAGTNGQVLALVSGVPTWVATSSINNGVSSLAQTFGTAQTGAVTFATSSQTTNGQTTGLNITNTAGAFTFAPTLSGTLTVGGGGTGQTTFASGQLLYGNGTNALSSVATGTVASGAGISVTGGQSIIGSGLTITNTGVTSLTGTANQITASAGTGAVTLSIPTQFNISNASTTNLSANTLAVGGTGTTSISSTGSLSTPSLSIGSLAGVLYGNSGAVNAIATSSFTPNAEFTTTGTIGAFVGGTNSTLALATNGVALTKLAQIAANTILGNPTGATGNVTALSTSTLSIGGTAGNVTGIVAVSNGGTGWNAITANTVLLGNGSGAISTTSAGTNGQVLALVSGVPTWVATSSINNGVSSLAQTFGTAQTGAVTFATSSQTTNGQTTGLNITNTAGAFTFAPTLSGTLTVGGGGTGQTTFASGQLLYGNGTNALSSVATGTVASGAGISVTGGQSIIGSGLTITNTGVTSLTGTANQITASAGTGAVTLSIPTQFNISNASTTNLSANTLAVGGTGTTSISSTGSLSTPSLSIGSLAGVLYGNSGAVNAIATSSFTPNAEFTTTGTIGAFVGGTNSTLALATNGVALTKLAQIAANTILGNPTGATGNVTALSTSTLSIGGTAGNVTGIVAVSNGGTGWNAITANTVLLGNGSGAISTTSAGTNGQVLALVSGVPTWVATSSINNGVSSLAQTFGTAQTGAVTFATSSQTTNGQTTGLNITNTAGAFTFAPTLSGTLTVGGGGTGQTTFASGQLLYGNGTNALSSVSTSTLAVNGSISSSGTLGAQVGGSNTTLSLNMANANSWTALQSFTNASTSLFSNIGTAYFGGTSTTTISSTGAVSIPSAASLTVAGNTSLTNATTTALFSTNHLTNTFAAGQTGTTTISSTGALSAPSLTLTTALTVGNGGTGLNSVSDGRLLFGSGGTTALTALATSTGGTILQTNFSTGRPSWVATSTLGLGNGTFLGLSDTIGSYNANRVLFETASAVTDSANFTFNGTTLSVPTLSLTNALGLTSGGTATTTFYNGGVVFSDGTKLTQSSAAANFFWDETNNRLGIGTSSPQSLLHVQSSTGDGIVRIQGFNSNTGGIVQIRQSNLTGADVLYDGAIDAFQVKTYTSGSLTATPITIPLNGNVGIGTTTPTWLLNPSSSSAAQLALSAGAGIAQWAFRNAGGNLYFATTTVAGTATTSTSALTILGSSGNVGIASTSPGGQLSITNLTGTPALLIGSAAHATQFIVDSTGNVGIGTTTPGAIFSVHGNARFSGDIANVANVTATGTVASAALAVSGASTLASVTASALAQFSGNASTTLLSVANGLSTTTISGNATSTFGAGISVPSISIGSLTGILKATAGYVATALVNLATDVTGILGISNGGTGISSAPTYGQVLVGNVASGYDLVATSSLGIGVATLTDTLVSAPAKNDTILWNGTKWVNAPSGTSFVFSIASYTASSPNGGTVEIGSGTWKSAGSLSFSATYTNGPATNGYVSCSTCSPSWSNLTLGGAGFVGPTVSVTAVSYPATVGSTRVFTLNATDGSASPTSNKTFTFNNNRYWGLSTKTSGYTSSDVTSLGNSDLVNSKASTFSLTPGAGQYIIWASRTALGTITFTVGGFAGGFQAPETVTVTNASGFAETFYIYRSTNPALGATTVTTS